MPPFLKRPGGLVEYASAFLSPLFAFGWLGALVVTVLAALHLPGDAPVPGGHGGNGWPAVFLIPALLILMVLGQYNHPVSLCVGLCVVLGLAGVYVRIGHAALGRQVDGVCDRFRVGLLRRRRAVRGVCRFVRHFRVDGSVASRWLAACCAFSAVAVPLAAGVWLCDLSVREAYRGILLPTARYWLAVPSSALLSQSIRAALLLFFPVAALAVAWRRRPCRFAGVPPEAPAPAERRRHGCGRKSRHAPGFAWLSRRRR